MITFNWYLTMIYFIMKVLLIGVLVFQLSLINYLVASDQLLWGFKILWNLIYGYDWRINGFFPRVNKFL